MFVKISANKCGLFSLMDQTSWVGRVMTPAWNVAVRISAVFNEGSLKRFWPLKKWKPCWCYCFFCHKFLSFQIRCIFESFLLQIYICGANMALRQPFYQNEILTNWFSWNLLQKDTRQWNIKQIFKHLVKIEVSKEF